MTTRILLTCAAIGVAFGVLGIGNSVVMAALALAAPPFYPVLSGVFLLPGVVAVTLLRRPGVAILAQALAGLVAIGTTSSVMAPALAFILYGVFLELCHLVTRYRVWSAWSVYAAAILVGALNAVSSFALLGGESMALPIMLLAAVSILAATLLWVFLGRTLAKALGRVGLGAPATPARAAVPAAPVD